MKSREAAGLSAVEWELIADRGELPLLEQNPYIDNIDFAPEAEICASVFWRDSTRIQYVLPSAVKHKAARGR